MPSSEPEDQLRPPPQSANGEPSGPQETSNQSHPEASETGDDARHVAAAAAPPAQAASPAGEPAWPPEEARPVEATPEKTRTETAPSAEPRSEEAPSEKPPSEEPPSAGAAAAATGPGTAEPAAVPTGPEAASASKAEEPAAEPKQEMGLSESTLHWLVDGEQAVEPLSNDPSTAPHYDPSAAVPGRRRTIAVIGGAAILAVVVAAVLHAQAAGHRAAVEATTVEPAAVLTERAETALAAGRSGEAMDLAHLAIVTDPRYADAYAVEGKVFRGGGRLPEARDAYRKYLELAPLGTHAEEARQALAALPP